MAGVAQWTEQAHVYSEVYAFDAEVQGLNPTCDDFLHVFPPFSPNCPVKLKVEKAPEKLIKITSYTVLDPPVTPSLQTWLVLPKV